MEELKNKIVNLENINKKIDKIEYTDIKEIRQEIQDIKVDLTKNNVLTEQNINAINEMSETMSDVRNTMVKVSGAIECISTTNKELANNLKQQNNKIDRLQMRQDKYDENIEFMKKEIEKNEEKGKFDIVLFFKENFIEIIVFCGVLGYLFLK